MKSFSLLLFNGTKVHLIYLVYMHSSKKHVTFDTEKKYFIAQVQQPFLEVTSCLSHMTVT